MTAHRVAVLLLVVLALGCGSEQGGLDGELADALVAGDGASQPLELADQELLAAEVQGEAAAQDEIQSEPRWPDCDPAAASQTVTFVHVNDLHANYTPELANDLQSPYARIKAFHRSVEAENPYTLFTDGGDDFEKGCVAEPLSDGVATLLATFAMHFDVRVLGNHDFAWGVPMVLANARDPNAVVLASNTRFIADEPPDPLGFFGADWAEFQVGCVRVGFFGMVSKPWDEKNQQYDGPFFPEFETRYDYAERARELVEAHRKDVDLLVMVSHLGEGEDEALAAQVPGIDVILGGHSHTFLAKPMVVGGTTIVQEGSSALWVGRLDVTLDLETREVVGTAYQATLNAPQTLEPDPGVQAAVEGIMEDYAPDALVPLATVHAPRATRPVAAITALAATRVPFGGQAGLVDTDTVWRSWSAGGLSQQDLLDTFKMEREPSGTTGFNSFYVAAIPGADLARLAAELPERWALAAPDSIDPQATYRLALQKPAAFHPADYLPAGVTLGPPSFLGEAWEILEQYGRARTAACLSIDVDQPLAACPR
jgi:hypothetical protein